MKGKRNPVSHICSQCGKSIGAKGYCAKHPSAPVESVYYAKRQNPGASEKLQEWRGYPQRGSFDLYVPDGTPSTGLYKMAPLIALQLQGYPKDAVKIKRGVYVCGDEKNDRQIYFGSKTSEPLTRLPRGPIAKVTHIDYGPVLKSHLYDKAEEFTHRFGEEDGRLPTLWSDGKGGLMLKGGGYYITPEGIRN